MAGSGGMGMAMPAGHAVVRGGAETFDLGAALAEAVATLDPTLTYDGVIAKAKELEERAGDLSGWEWIFLDYTSHEAHPEASGGDRGSSSSGTWEMRVYKLEEEPEPQPEPEEEEDWDDDSD
jgi:hypothetical protein